MVIYDHSIDGSNESVTYLAPLPFYHRAQREVGIVNSKTQKNEFGPLDLGPITRQPLDLEKLRRG